MPDDLRLDFSLGVRALRRSPRFAAIVTGVGVLLGLSGAVAIARIMSSIVFRVSPLHPIVLGAATGFLVVVAAGAAYLPARRASTLAPRRVLQAE